MFVVLVVGNQKG